MYRFYNRNVPVRKRRTMKPECGHALRTGVGTGEIFKGNFTVVNFRHSSVMCRFHRDKMDLSLVKFY